MALNGIDISNWQAGINLSAVPADFVIVKVTEGTTYVSPVADTQYQGAKSTGRLLGVYHFATGAGAVEEAKFFLSNVQGYLGEAVLFLDWEGDVVAKGVGYAKAFLDYVYQQTSIRPLIYMSKSVTNSYDWSTVSANYGLWVAQYADTNPTGYQDDPWTDAKGYGSWSGPAIFQYASTGRLSGYNGNLDLDRFYGDTEAWHNFAKSDRVTPEPNPEPEPPKITPIVQYADPDGNKAYAYTHWQAIVGKPDLSTVVLTSPNGTKYQLMVDDTGVLTTKVVSE
ncbi:GH25 family lysozyme [Weissella confusa]|uniref:GH25 family lysozyme n=1 Tax=Weissella confusa TaxID=1583 RepID=UPI0018F1AF3A|nr:GH25 family lysozyme [Weissella confusa]MBJ7681049.1 lysozyme [Weissella confusa]MBJ7683236.1 lysozyme [Weissella confusa]MBJ7701829.1 lysozyme [Weissella confusa]